MADRTINFGSDDTEATYQIQDDDPAGGGDFVIRDTDANVAILSYDQTNDEWDFAATANFNSNAVSGITSLDADSVSVDTLAGADIANASADEALLSDGNGNLTFGSAGVEEFATFGNLPAIDPPQLAYVADEDQYYRSNNTAGFFDITSASFSTDINTQDSTSTGIAWNDDGSRLYEVGANSDKIYQYTVSTPFDISSASFDTDFTSQYIDSFPSDIAWNNDGSRIYVVGMSGGEVRQFEVSTPFDISSAQWQGAGFQTQDSNSTGIAWNNDGSRLYEVGRGSGGTIYEYSLFTPFNIDTVVSTGTTLDTQDSTPEGIAFNDDGSRLYEVDRGVNKIYQYTLLTPFDIETAFFTKSIEPQDVNANGIAWNNDGSRLYEVGETGDKIYQYTLDGKSWEEF